MPKAATTLAALLLAAPFCLAGPLGAEARSARHHHHYDHHRYKAKVHKTHRVVAGNKSIRINDAGQVITNQNP